MDPLSNLNFNCSVTINDLFPRANIICYDQRDLGDGGLINVKKCSKRRCTEFCPRFLPACRVYSTITGRYIDCKNEDFPREIDCSSVNVIYVITCATCGLQYVGETACAIGIRFITHRAVIRGKDYSNSCKRLGEHFTTGRCKGSDYFIQVVEQMSGNGRLANGEIDLGLAKERKRREDMWMLKLRTVYPYGLNDALNFTPNSDEPYASREGVNGIVGKLFPRLPRILSYPKRVHNHNSSNFDPTTFLNDIEQWLFYDPMSASSNIRIALSSMKKSHLKSVALQLNDFLSGVSQNFMFYQWYRLALDIIETKVYKTPKIKSSRSVPKHKLSILFVNKAMDFINLPQILRSKNVSENAPHLMEDDDVPMVVFSLTDPIRSAILNYKKFVKHLDLNTFCLNKDSVPCPCKNYDHKFIDPSCKHILTGDLSIIKNNKLRKLICKGPKYREPEYINWADAKMLIDAELDSFIECLSNKKGVSPPYFSNWKHTILNEIDSKIAHFSPKVRAKKVQKALENEEVKKELKTLQKSFVLVPIDKASNNIAFVCKQHYASVIKAELGYLRRSTRNGTSGSLTYELCNVGPEDVVNQQVGELVKYNLQVDEDFQCLPSMYWSPKLHKDPIGSRFIIASKQSSLKPLLKDLTCIFKLFQKQVESFNDKSRIWSGVSGCWIIQNSNPVVDRIEKINNRNKAATISTFDFATLYTKIPHELLIDALNEVVDFAFEGGIANAVYINSFGASWRNSSDARSYRKSDIKKALKYSIENAYFQVGDMVFRQKIGIPIGSDPAPFFANLFLYIYMKVNLLKIF